MNTNSLKIILSLSVILSIGLAGFGAMPLVAKADNPVPFISSVTPTSTPSGSAGSTLTVNGSNFVPGSVVNINGSPRSTTYISPSQLTVSIPASDFTYVGTPNITVTNPAPGGGTS